MSAAAAGAQPASLRSLFASPGFVRLFGASMAGRLPAAALGLVLILRTRELTGSYAASGAVVGAYVLATGLAAPGLGRLVDRRGQPAVLLVSAAVNAAALIVFALLQPGVSPAVAAAIAAVAGTAQPPLGACLRTLWPRLLPDSSRLHAAFALEGSALEITYIVGPVVIAGAIGAWSTAAATLVCAALVLGGTAVFAAHPASREWRSEERRAGGLAGALHSTGVRTLMAVFVLIGATFGAVEVAVTVAAEEADVPGAAGLLLGAWGLGSMLGGIAAAHTRPPSDPVRRLCLLLAVLALGHLPLALASAPALLAGLLLLAGVAIAPTIAGAYALVESRAPAGTVTEAYTWLTTGIAAGLAAGAAVAGVLAQRDGAGLAFATAAAACVCAAAVAVLGRRSLRAGRPGSI